jgi:hypothetical protein
MEAQNNNEAMEQRLWDYIDGISASPERSAVEELLAANAAWKNKYAELLEMSKLLKASELEMPSLRFTRNVMEEIAKLHIAPATKTYINKRIIWGIFLFFLLMIGGFLIYGFSQMKWETGHESSIVKNVTNIDYSVFFNNTWMNVIMMINVMVGLLLLDNWLERKRKAFRREI